MGDGMERPPSMPNHGMLWSTAWEGKIRREELNTDLGGGKVLQILIKGGLMGHNNYTCRRKHNCMDKIADQSWYWSRCNSFNSASSV